MTRLGFGIGVWLLLAASATATVTVEPARVVLGSGQVVKVSAGGEARWSASLGEVRGGVLELGDRRAPGFAIVAAEVGGERSAAVVELIGAGALPTETSPGAQVTVDIDGRAFGPVTADADGKAAVPVEVPPRARVAKVHSVDTRGLSTTREIALPRAPWPGALVVAPATLQAGETGSITVFAIGEDGEWRDPGASAPLLALHGAIEAAGPARAAGAGRWELPVRAVIAAEDVEVGAFVDGLPAVSARLTVTRAPAVVRPPRPPPAARPPWDATLRAGAASAFGPLLSMTLGAEVGWPLHSGQPSLLLVGSVLGARGSAGDGELSQLSFGLGAAVRFRLAPAWSLDAHIGAGWTLASAALPMSSETDGAPITWAGVSVARGPLVLDLRYADVRLASTMRVDGNTVGVGASLGYRLRF